MVAREVGPHHGREHELGVGGLPEKEIAEPLLAAGSDQEIRIGNARGEQPRGEQRLVDVVGRDLARLDRLGEPPRRLDDFAPAAVVERHDERQRAIVAGRALGLVDERDDIVG